MSWKKIFQGLFFVSIFFITFLVTLSFNQKVFSADEFHEGFRGTVTYRFGCTLQSGDAIYLASYPAGQLLDLAIVVGPIGSQNGGYINLLPPDPGPASNYYIVGLGSQCQSEWLLVYWPGCNGPFCPSVTQNVVINIENAEQSPGQP